MKQFLKSGLLATMLLTGCLMSCTEDDEMKNSLVLSKQEAAFAAEGGSISIALQTDAEDWRIQNLTDWISITPTNGTEQSTFITLTVTSKTPEVRTDTLTVFAGDAEALIIVSQAASDFLYEITSSYGTINFLRGGSTNQITVSTTAPSWEISADQDWVSFSKTSGSSGNTSVDITTAANPAADSRSAIITISAEYTASVSFTIVQKGEYYPSYNTSPQEPDATGMSSTAAQLVSEMGLGWNLGNTLEAIGGETAWGNPKTTQEMIDLIKASGFNSVRLPCAWDQYVENAATAKIKETWLNRVKEVVQYCANNDMYVLLNIHWDGGWLENNINAASQEANNAKQKAFWEQIATHFRDFDEHLLFASANEPNVENSTQMAVLTSYHQTFIDAVRSTGGKNTYRVLVVQGPSTDIQKTYDLMKTMPTDPTPNKLMAEVHFYTPYNFCLMNADADWGKMFYYWGAGNHSTTDTERNPTYGEESDVDQLFGKMKTKFTSKGIPVILGEFAATRRLNLTGEALELHLKSRAYYNEYVVRKAKANGMVPFYWDNGGTGNDASGIFDRRNNKVYDQLVLDGLLKGME